MEKQLYRLDTGPKMLPRKQRGKVWMAMGVFSLWIGGCWSLLSYRLRSDDLELMEREVYDDLAKKKEVDRMNQGYSTSK